MLVVHEKGFRRRWMVPRNLRKIYPWKIAQILTLIQQSSSYSDWSGNQSIQNSFFKALEDSGLKRAGVQYDPHSGGPRTYLSQLACLGLVFKRGAQVFFTQAGQDILDGHPPLPILQRQLLKHQYPSAYGSSRMVRINPSLKIKPFLFVLEILNNPSVRSLSREELAVLLVYGHRHSSADLCIEKILALRAGMSLKDVIDDEDDLYTPRSQKFPEGLLDDANTFKNYLQACCLVYEELENGLHVLKFDEGARELYVEYLSQRDEFITLDSEEAFQRRYGARTDRGDTRQIVEQDQAQLNPAASMILSQFYALCGENMISVLPDEFVNTLSRGYGFSRQQICESIAPHLGQALNYFEATYIELSRSGLSSKATKFEKATEAIFRDRLLFSTTHTGQRRRPSGRGGYADLFLIALDQRHCALVDTKASAKYALPHTDILKMANTYIPNYRELCLGQNLSLEFASYVAGGFSGQIASGVHDIARQTGIPCNAISARRLLSLANQENLDQPEARALLSTSGVLD